MALSTILLVYPIDVLSQNPDDISPLDDIFPADDNVGPVGNVDAESKFDDGFHQKIQELIDEVPQEGDYGVYDGTRYYNVIIVVTRDDGDDRDPDEVAKENKDSIVRFLELIGARDVVAAESLSFVTASIPVADVPGFSFHEEVYQLGDGELPITLELDTARQTIHATDNDLRMKIARTLDGNGVVVGVLDTGINHDTAFTERILDRVLCDPTPCSPATAESVTGQDPPFVTTSHGTRVAQVLAASELPEHNGIALGVDLLDASIGRHGNFNPSVSIIAHALDWSLKNGADVVNMSFGEREGGCPLSESTTVNLIVNEAVDKGMFAVKSAGNKGLPVDTPIYGSITNPGCAHNVITVGGIDDRNPNENIMYLNSSRGPATALNILKPEIVAPATNLQLLRHNNDDSITRLSNGTSYATPQVSATVAMMLQIDPELTPAEIKTALLLGANWTGPIPCTSTQYEQNNPNDNCSHARQPTTINEANNAASLEILNNVGFGILNTAESLRYVHTDASYIISDYVDTASTTKQYQFQVTDTTEPVKTILTWLVSPHGDIVSQATQTNQAPIANLDFIITASNNVVFRAESANQLNEFVVFDPPVTGTYTITVTGSNLDNLNKPVQNFALGSTNSLTAIPSSTNRAPVAQSHSVIVSPGMETVVRLTATDSDNDAVSFNISRDPTRGIVSTDEFITKTLSRAIYTANPDFAGTDTFQITPHDGTDAGTPATITLRAESLPSGSTNVSLDTSTITEWDTVHITSGFAHVGYSQTFSGPSYAVPGIHIGSNNMEEVHMTFTAGGTTYTVAIPPSGSRNIEFSSPLTISSLTLSANGLDGDAIYPTNQAPDVRMFVGYVPSSSCPASGTDDVSGSSCPAPTYNAMAESNAPIVDNTRRQDTTSTINVPIDETISSISVQVDIDHTWIGDIKVVLTAPDGTAIVLHDRTGGNTDDIKRTYSSSDTTALAALVGSQIKGDWTLSVGDYLGGFAGTLNSWGLEITYEASTVVPTDPPLPPVNNMIFFDDFESGLGKWTESGEGDWRTAISQSHSVPTAPDHERSNLVLHSDNCDTLCTMTLKDSINLTGYSSATLSFLRFVDSGLDRDEHLKVELYNGRTWNTVFHWSHNRGGDDNRWNAESYDLSSYLGVSNFKIRLVTQQSSSSEDVQIDDVVINGISGTPPITPPTPPDTPSPPTTISEDFESGLDSWVQSGNRNWITRTASPIVPGSSSGNDVAHASNCDTLCVMTLETPVDLSSRQSGYLTFDRFVGSGLDPGEYLRVELHDGSIWRTIFDWQASARADDNTWHTESYNLGSRYLVDDMNIRITAKSTTGSEITMIDNISISNSAPPNPPPPNLPAPTSYSIYVADTDDQEVLVFAQDGTALGNFVDRRAGGLGKVWDVTFGPDGHLYASDNTNYKIRKYNGATGSPISSSSGWATTIGFPNGLAWNGDTLYVATGRGVERFSSSGTTLGYFGDASRNPSTSGAPAILTAADLVFCNNRMYVTDRGADIILYYSASSGTYLGQISGTSSSPPNTFEASGIECDTRLYQSGDDNGRVNEINRSTGSLINEITTRIDEPYNMDLDSAGNLYVANKDDDNIVKINSGTVSVAASGGLDDPRGVTLGPAYAGGASGESEDLDVSNDEPEFALYHNGTKVFGPIHPDAPQMTFSVQATDAENDTMTIEIVPDGIPEEMVSITDHGNGTATVLIDTEDAADGAYVFWVMVSDEYGYDREPYGVVIP